MNIIDRMFLSFDPLEKARRGRGGLRSRYRDKTGIAWHREWRGIRDTAYDYMRWTINVGTLIGFAMKSPIRIIKAILRYRWMGSYLATLNFVDKGLEGARGPELRIGHLHMHAIISQVTVKLAQLFRADERFGQNSRSKRIVAYDETMPPIFLSGFPNLVPMPLQTFPEFLICNIDQHLMPHYIDVLESFGLPPDVCSRCVSEAGVAADDDYPIFGACLLTSNMPCDGSIMTSDFQARRIKLPSYPVMMPMRHSDPEVHKYSVDQIKGAIAFVEEQTGERFDWKAFFAAAKDLNEQNTVELQKWEFFKTPYSPLYGETQSLYRLFAWASVNGLNARFAKLDRKVLAIMEKCYENKYIPYQGRIRHRCIIWSTAAVFYTDFPVWLLNCWGIQVVINMDSTMGHNMIDLEDHDKALLDVALLSEKSTMRHHATGGYENVHMLWPLAEEFNCDMILFYDQIACKGMNGVHGVFEDESRSHDIRFMWVEHDLQDPRTISRQQMREQVNKYMRTVLQETPLDATLENFDDSLAW